MHQEGSNLNKGIRPEKKPVIEETICSDPHNNGGGGSSSSSSKTVTGPMKFRYGVLQLMIHTLDPLHDGKYPLIFI